MTPLRMSDADGGLGGSALLTSESVTTSAQPELSAHATGQASTGKSWLAALTVPGPCSASMVTHRPPANRNVYWPNVVVSTSWRGPNSACSMDSTVAVR